MDGLTFADIDRMEADREAKRVECVERLTIILAKEFSLNELKFIWNAPGNVIWIEAVERARLKAR